LAKKHAGRIHDGAVWKVLDDEKEEGPYCPVCYKKTNHFIQPRRGALNNGIAAFFSGEHVYRERSRRLHPKTLLNGRLGGKLRSVLEGPNI